MRGRMAGMDDRNPLTTICDRCGRTLVVKAVSPSYDQSLLHGRPATIPTPNAKLYEFECPTCSPRIQRPLGSGGFLHTRPGSTSVAWAGDGSEVEWRMKFRKLRIAWSVACGIACVLLVALWVRSYKHDDALQALAPSSSPLVLRSFKGQLSFWRWHGVNATRRIPTKALNEDLDDILSSMRPRFYWGFGRLAYPLGPGAGVFVPHRFPVLISAALAAIPWLPWWSRRFSLRTLLIATTLVAVVLGIGVYAARK